MGFAGLSFGDFVVWFGGGFFIWLTVVGFCWFVLGVLCCRRLPKKESDNSLSNLM